MKKINTLLVLLTLLTACAAPAAEEPLAAPTPAPTETVAPTPEEPTPHWEFRVDDTHGVLEVPVGGKLGTVLITEAGDVIGDGDRAYYLVWNAYDWSQPIQVLGEVLLRGFPFSDCREIVDVNFDGRMDFGYRYDIGSGQMSEYGRFWIWDEEQGQFVEELALAGIPFPEFDEDTEVITGWGGGLGWRPGCRWYYKWINGELLCVREVESESWASEPNFLRVKDLVDGNMQEVFYKEYQRSQEETLNEGEDARKWQNLDYHGEP